MAYKIELADRAKRDASEIYEWIADRSPEGADRWYGALLDAANSLTMDPERCGVAYEAEDLPAGVRELLFKTPKGKRYRILFLMSADVVTLLCIRGPGQAPVTSEDLK